MVWFIYVCVDDVETSVKRIKQRAYQGGHSGSEDTISEIRSKSLANLPRVLDKLGMTIDFLDVYDNSEHRTPPHLLVSFEGRNVTYLYGHMPA